MSVLVTGGAGFIGSHVADRLLEEGQKVTVIDDLSNGTESNLSGHREDRNLKIRIGDVRNERIVAGCMKSVDIVVHLAALTRARGDGDDSSELVDVNVKGTMNLLQEAHKHNVRKFVLASSAAVYGQSSRMPLKEDFPVSAVSPYAASKISSEQLCRSFRESYGLDAISLRLFNVYGPRQLADGNGGVVAKFVRNLSRGMAPEITGDGEQTRDFVHVSDVVECISRVIQREIGVGALNLGSGIPVTINDLANLVSRLFRSTKPPTYKPSSGREIRRSQASMEMAQKCLSYTPRVTLEDGVAQLAREAGGTRTQLVGELS